MTRPGLILIVVCYFFPAIVESQSTDNNLIIDLTSSGNQSQSTDRYCVLRPLRENGSWKLSRKDRRQDEGLGVRFSCKEGFKILPPDPYDMCEEYWDLSKAPTCNKLCPHVHATFSTTVKCFDKDNNKIGCDEATDGSYLTYTCAPFYDPPYGYNTTMVCSDGRWSAPDPICLPACGKKTKRESPGNEVEEYPWTVAVFSKLQDDYISICGGTLISEQLVLTAAHCVVSPDGDVLPAKNYQVAAGTLHNKYKDLRDPRAQYLQVSSILAHPNFRGTATNFQWDMAILLTKEKFRFNGVIQPICVLGVEDIEIQIGSIGVVATWNIIEPEKEPRDKLKTLEILYKAQPTCYLELPENWAKPFYTPDKLCAGLFNQSKSVCKGDGGAGLAFRNEKDGKYYIHGIVSVAPSVRGECDPQQNALYTNVSYHHNYIKSILNGYSVRQCTLPPFPDDGMWVTKNKKHKPGDIVPSDIEMTISCDEGYKLSSSNAKVICHSSFLMPTCQKLCPAPLPTFTSILKCVDSNQNEIGCDKATNGDSLSYKCRPLHEAPFGYESTIFCANGEWSSPGPVCRPICGKKVNNDIIPLIHGSKLLEVVKYPWVIALYRKNGEGYDNVCGGTILSQRVALTAAHCVTNEYGDLLAPENHVVAAGKLYNNYGDPRDPKPQYLQIFHIMPHSSYKGNSRHYLADIAVLITRESFQFNFFVHPVCFEGMNDIDLDDGDLGIVTGWGVTEDNEVSDQLKVLEIPYKHQQICAKELPPGWGDRYNLIDKLCVGFYNQNKSLCSGDSGGGLFYKNKDNRYYLHGVVSLGHALRGNCNFRQNSLYTKIAFHYNFIHREFTNYHLKECTLPPHPENGRWIVENKDKKPGDTVLSDTVLTITCKDGFRLSSDNEKIRCESVFLMPKCQNSSTPEVANSTEIETKTKVTCIYDSKRNGISDKPDDMNITLCTHLIFDSIGLTQDGQIKIPQIITNEELQRFVMDLKTKNSRLKVLVSVYGNGKDTDEYPVMAATATKRKKFVENVNNFVEDYNFDGLNIHWDVPLSKDRENYGQLLKELRRKLKPEWLLTASVHYSPIDLGYNHMEMYNNLDWFNVECYGLYGAWSLYTGQNAALYPSSVENDFERSTYNLQQCAENWLLYSYKDKLSLGVAFFGRYFTLKDPNQHGLHAPVTGRTHQRDTDRVTYAEICQKYNNWTRVWDDEQKNPYKYNADKWLGYDDKESIQLKTAYIEKIGCFGVTAFPINGDDIHGKCGPKQVLLQHIYTELRENSNANATN